METIQSPELREGGRNSRDSASQERKQANEQGYTLFFKNYASVKTEFSYTVGGNEN